MDNIAKDIVDEDPVANLERLVGDDDSPAKEVTEEVLRCKRNGDTDDPGTGDQGVMLTWKMVRT